MIFDAYIRGEGLLRGASGKPWEPGNRETRLDSDTIQSRLEDLWDTSPPDDLTYSTTRLPGRTLGDWRFVRKPARCRYADCFAHPTYGVTGHNKHGEKWVSGTDTPCRLEEAEAVRESAELLGFDGIVHWPTTLLERRMAELREADPGPSEGFGADGFKIEEPPAEELGSPTQLQMEVES